MIDFLMFSGFALLFLAFPASIVLTIVFAIKKKNKVIFSAIGIPVSFILSLVFLGVGGYFYGQTDGYKERLVQQELESREIEEQGRIEEEKKSEEEQEETESREESVANSQPDEGEEAENAEISKEEKSVDEMTEEEYKEQCEELWHDNIFFSKDNLKGHHVKLEIYIEECRYFETFLSQTTTDFIKKYNLQRDLFACGVSRGEPNSYVGGQISVYFSDDYGYKQSDYETGQELIIYGEIVDYSTNTWDGYNVCGVMPRYIEEK